MVAMKVYGCGGGLDLGTSAHTHTHTHKYNSFEQCVLRQGFRWLCVHASGERETKGERCIMGSFLSRFYPLFRSLSLTLLISLSLNVNSHRASLEQLNSHKHKHYIQKFLCTNLSVFYVIWVSLFCGPRWKKKKNKLYSFSCAHCYWWLLSLDLYLNELYLILTFRLFRLVGTKQRQFLYL